MSENPYKYTDTCESCGCQITPSLPNVETPIKEVSFWKSFFPVALIAGAVCFVFGLLSFPGFLRSVQGEDVIAFGWFIVLVEAIIYAVIDRHFCKKDYKLSAD